MDVCDVEILRDPKALMQAHLVLTLGSDARRNRNDVELDILAAAPEDPRLLKLLRTQADNILGRRGPGHFHELA